MTLMNVVNKKKIDETFQECLFGSVIMVFSYLNKWTVCDCDYGPEEGVRTNLRN